MNLRLGITGKLLIWFLAIIAIFYGTILVLYINVQQVVGLSGSIVAKNYAIASTTKKMMEALLNMEENRQKYQLLKKDDYLTFFNEAQISFEDNLSQVVRLTTMGHTISQSWQEISQAYRLLTKIHLKQERCAEAKATLDLALTTTRTNQYRYGELQTIVLQAQWQHQCGDRETARSV